MNNRLDRESWFEVLDVPGGGIRSLREKVARYERRRRQVRRVAGVAAVLAVFVALVSFLTWTALPHREADLIAGDDLLAIRLGIVEPPVEPVSVPPALRHEIAVRRVPTTDPRVIIYRVGRVAGGHSGFSSDN